MANRSIVIVLTPNMRRFQDWLHMTAPEPGSVRYIPVSTANDLEAIRGIEAVGITYLRDWWKETTQSNIVEAHCRARVREK